MKSKLDLEKLDLSGWPLPDDYLAEVGRIALLWARLEKLLCTAVANLAGFDNLADPRVYLVFTRGDFQQNLQLLEELCTHLQYDNPQMQGFEQVIGQLAAAAENKNRYIMGGMAPDPGDGSVEMGLASPTDRFDVTAKHVPLSELRAVSLEIDAAQHALYKLVMTLEKPASVWVSN